MNDSENKTLPIPQSRSTDGLAGTFWLSYGGGVNSTALAILLVRGKLPQYEPWRIVFADTGEERPETYAFIRDHFELWLARHGKTLEIVRPKETILERWERLKVTGSRLLRGCTVEGKIKPIERHKAANGGGVQLIGIDAGEAHRMPDTVRPLVDLDIDREGCEAIIKAEGLPSPGKSGCWCCPFMRVSEVIKLAKLEPCKFERIERLENVATETHGRIIRREIDEEGNVISETDGGTRTQWGDRPASYWRQRAGQGDLWYDEGRLLDDAPHCGCYDG